MVTVDVKFKDLREVVVELNKYLEAETIKGKIKLVGADKETILKDFMTAMDGIEDVDGKCPAPKAALQFYNKVVELEEKAMKKAEAEAEEKAKVKKPEKTEKPEKTKKPEKTEKPEKFAKPAKLGKPTVTKKSIALEGVQKEGGSTIEEMAERCTEAGLGDFETNVKTVGLWLRKLGIPVKKTDGGKWVAK